MNELFDITGKVALVTGGTRGIGAMIARGLVDHGARTYISARSAAECQAVAGELSNRGECIAIPSDVSTLEGIRALVHTFGAREEQLDILVNNAGIFLTESFESVTEADWNQVMDLNLKAPFFLTQQLLSKLKQCATQQDPSRVINIASIVGMPDYGTGKDVPCTYVTSKAAVIQMTRNLAMCLADDNITVNAISPGMFPTTMSAAYRADHAEEIVQAIPLHRIGMQEDIVGAVIYLSSRTGAWLTGINLPVDGGKTIHRQH